MGTKRSAEDLGNLDYRARRQDAKRPRITPLAEKDNSSEPSSCSVSEDSALQSSPPASDHHRASSLSSIQSPLSEDDSVSSPIDSESATDSDSASDLDEEIITIGGPKKPRMTQIDVTESAQDLRTRLSSLLPQLAASNDLLASSGSNLNMEDVEDGEQHIEMNLGLGVLEERGQSESSSLDGSSEEDGDVDEDNEEEMLPSEAVWRSPSEKNSNVMLKLLGRSRTDRRPGIEDMG